MTKEDLENRFNFHPVTTSERGQAHERVRTYMLQMATEVNDTLPESREKSTVITKLEEAMFWWNAAISRQS